MENVLEEKIPTVNKGHMIKCKEAVTIANTEFKSGDSISFVSKKMSAYAVYMGAIKNIYYEPSEDITYLEVDLEKTSYNICGLYLINIDNIIMASKL